MGCGRSIPLSERDPESSEEESRVSDVRNSSNINNHNGERNRRASDVDQGESNNVTRSRGEGIENDGTEETSSSSIRSRTDTDMWQRHHMMRASACEPTKSLTNTQNDKAVGHFFKGSGFVEEDKYDEACKEFTIAIDLREDFATAYLMRGRVYEQLDELQDALNDFTKAVKLRSDYVAAFISRGRVYNKLHQYDNAIEDCTVAIDISPEEATAFQTRAGAYQSKGDLDKAMEDFERAGLLSEQKLCVVCLDNPRSTRIHPCLHAVLCAPCAQDLLSMKYSCPLCSQQIDYVEQGAFDKTFAFDDFPMFRRTLLKESERRDSVQEEGEDRQEDDEAQEDSAAPDIDSSSVEIREPND